MEALPKIREKTLDKSKLWGFLQNTLQRDQGSRRRRERKELSQIERKHGDIKTKCNEESWTELWAAKEHYWGD